MLRKLPVYIIVDISFSMRGKPIEKINNGFHELIYTLRKDPMLVEVMYLCIITYNTLAQELLTTTPVYNSTVPEVSANGKSNMGAAFSLLHKCMQRDICKGNVEQERKGDYQPIVYLLTDGAPSDAWKNKLKVLKNEFNPRIISFGTADARMDILESISGHDTVNLNHFEDDISKFNELVSQSIGYCSRSIQTGLELSALPLLKGVYDEEELF